MALTKQPSFWNRFLRKLRDVLIAGLVVTVPIGLTIWIFVWLFTQIDKILRPWIEKIFGHQVVGTGFAVIVALVLIVGLIATNVIGKRIVRWAESQLSRVPIGRIIYVGIRQVIQSFSDPEKTGFMQVVMVEYPRKGIHTIGFVTNEHIDESGKKLVNVFIPTAPNPMTGFIQIVDESELLRTSITVEEALKMVVSAGRMSPKEVGDKMVQAKSEAEKAKHQEP
jgi:uncharacterized membrane protein